MHVKLTVLFLLGLLFGAGGLVIIVGNDAQAQEEEEPECQCPPVEPLYCADGSLAVPLSDLEAASEEPHAPENVEVHDSPLPKPDKTKVKAALEAIQKAEQHMQKTVPAELPEPPQTAK